MYLEIYPQHLSPLFDEIAQKSTSYTYDSAGNRKSETVVEANSGTTTSYEYNSRQWLTEAVESIGTIQKVTRFDYDFNGNLYSKSTEVLRPDTGMNAEMTLTFLGINAGAEQATIYKYDGLNRLIKVIAPSSTEEYTYNGENKRIGKSSGNVTSTYYYDNDRVVVEISSKYGIVRNIYGANLVARVVGEQTGFYLYNGHGDVTFIMNASGTVLANYSYDSFGNTIGTTGEFYNPYRYAGYEYDKSTKLYYLNARYFDPSVGRFISQDSYCGKSDDPLSLNRYTYCRNNPLSYYDPTGNFFESITDMFNTAAGYIKTNVIDPVAQLASKFYNSIATDTKQFYSNHEEAIATGATATGLIVGGAAVMGVSGGTATPAVVTVAGTVLGGAMIGAGVEMAYTMLQDYMVDGAINYAKNQYAAAGIRGAVSGGLASAGGIFIFTIFTAATTMERALNRYNIASTRCWQKTYSLTILEV